MSSELFDIFLGDEEMLKAFKVLPFPPAKQIADTLHHLAQMAREKRPITEEEIREFVPYLRWAWAWLTAHQLPALAISDMFVSLVERSLIGASLPCPSGTDANGEWGDSRHLSSLIENNPLWAELGTVLVVCSQGPFLETLRSLRERNAGHVEEKWPRFISALGRVPSLTRLRHELKTQFPGSARPTARAVGRARADKTLELLAEFLASWLRDSVALSAADLFQRLRENRGRLEKWKSAAGKALPVDILETLCAPLGEAALLRAALSRPELEILVRVGQDDVRVGKKADLSDEEKETLIQGVLALEYKLGHRDKSASVPEIDAREVIRVPSVSAVGAR